jgi:hypothetical protein
MQPLRNSLRVNCGRIKITSTARIIFFVLFPDNVSIYLKLRNKPTESPFARVEDPFRDLSLSLSSSEVLLSLDKDFLTISSVNV